MSLATDTTTEQRQSASPAGDARALVGAALFSEHPAELAAFYGMLLGVRFERRQHEDGREHRVADLRGLHLEIKSVVTADGEATSDAHRSGSVGTSNIELSFEFPDTQSALEYALTLGATELQPVSSHTWGDWAVVLDPDGNRLGLYSPAASDTVNNDGEGA